MIKNLTRGILISEKAKKAVALKDLIFGMILSKNSDGLIFETRFGIHTFFMSKSIDVLIMDKKNKVVKIKENLKPFNIFVWNPIYNIVIELPAGSVKKSNSEVGDRLSF